MAYTLKTSGLATALSFCVAVDEDGTTVREFVSSTVNGTMTLTNVAVGSATWKGVSRGHFSSAANGSFNYFGPKFVTNKPSIPDAFGLFLAFNSRSAPSGTRTLIEGVEGSNTGALAEINAAGRLFATRGGGAIGNTALPTGATKFSCGHNHAYNVANDFFYGLESGSGAADGTGADAGWGAGTTVVSGIGGCAGQGNSPGQYFIVAGFNRRLTTAEYQSLHDDWFGVLFESAVANAPPVITTTGTALAYSEGDGAVVIDSGITVTDADNANLTSATVAITANYSSGQDVLAFADQLGITGSWNSGTGVLTLSGTTTLANYQTALRAVTFANAAPTSGTRVVTFTANDGTATGSATRSIAVTGANVIAATVGNAVAAGSQAQILTALAGRITTKALRYPNTTLRASVPVTLRVSHPTTGAHVVDVAATTDANGIAEIYSAALTAGGTYAVEVIETSTGFRRLPVVVATA
jgi:hypothetical protein